MEQWTTVAPSAALTDVVEFFWLAPPSLTGRFEALPDGRLDVAVFTAERPMFEIYGPVTRPRELTVLRDVCYAGFRLRPHVTAAVIGDDARHYLDQRWQQTRLAGLSAETLGPLTCADELEPKLGPLALALARRASSQARRVQQFVRVLETMRGQSRIEHVAAELGLTRRTLERVVAAEAGLTPKALARIIRLEALAEQLRRTKASWADLAAEYAYADQAHLIRDVRALTGYTPRQFAEKVRHMPHGWV